MSTKPTGVPYDYIQVGPDHWAHPTTVAAVRSAQPKPDGGRPSEDTAVEARGKRGVAKPDAAPKRRGKIGRVCLIALRNRELDDDNLASSYKHLRDAIADSLLPGLAPGAADGLFRWECHQVTTSGENGTIVAIHITP